GSCEQIPDRVSVRASARDNRPRSLLAATHYTQESRMPPPKTYDKLKMSLEDQRFSVRFSRGKLRRHPLTGAFVPVFQSLLDEVDAVEVKSKAIEDEINDAQIDIYIADDGLNDFATEVWKAIEIVGDPAVRHLFFGDKTLSEFNRPILNDQYT